MIAKVYGNNPVTSEDFKKVTDFLNDFYSGRGLRVKNMTCYVRMSDETGETNIEPADEETVLTFRFKTHMKNGEVQKSMKVEEG